MDSPSDIERISVLLSKLIERKILGTREIMDLRRRYVLDKEYMANTSDLVQKFISGSTSEGISLLGSDSDCMFVEKNVKVMYPGDRLPPDSTQKTVLYVREADCRPGYVNLQLGDIGMGQRCTDQLLDALVSVGNSIFVSSDMYRESHIKSFNKTCGMKIASNGPSGSNGYLDYVCCFHMSRWAREADQWVKRPRLHGWPTEAMIDKIVHSGCHVVPVGDKCSNDTLLQWRLSFASAERLLVHSFSHTQMKVYFLLKYFLQQMKPTLQNILGKEDEDILCSYHLKNVMFHSVENSHPNFWQEQNLLYCFWFCFNILISCVRAGHFPQYFIPTNNLFQRKVHGQNQHKLLQILDRFHSKKFLCLLNVHGTPCRVDLLENVSFTEVQTALMHPQSVQEIEYTQDMFVNGLLMDERWMPSHYESLTGTTIRAMDLLMKSHSDLDEAVTFTNTVRYLKESAKREAHQTLKGSLTNKTRYQTLRKCQHRLTLCASLDTNILDLATFYFLTGNYYKVLTLCQYIISQPSYLSGPEMFLPEDLEAMYLKQYCGKGYTMIERLKKTLAGIVTMHKTYMHLPHFHLEVSRNTCDGVSIHPLPYALFLSFLCYHELRDERGRDETLRNLIRVQSHDRQGGDWMGYTMLGICYEIIGDYPQAISEYLELANTCKHRKCTATQRIDALLKFVT